MTMAVPTQAELLRVGGAALLATILWGDSTSLRALVMGVAAISAFVSLAESSGSVFKSMDKDKAMAGYASAALKTLQPGLEALSGYADRSAFLHVAIVCVAALFSSWIVKTLGIPGYPWSAVLLGAFCGWCLRSFSLEEHDINDDINDAACPYNKDFWDGLAPADSLEGEDEDDFLADMEAKEQEDRNRALAESFETESFDADDEDLAGIDEEEELEGDDYAVMSAHD
mmetsp:Transcript_34045/g.60207  ORF Transcript_34045/g.60207 Transcript_34045/m.60207 type:complete len:228 (-) Transcript_34045:153-836(-)